MPQESSFFNNLNHFWLLEVCTDTVYILTLMETLFEKSCVYLWIVTIWYRQLH